MSQERGKPVPEDQTPVCPRGVVPSWTHVLGVLAGAARPDGDVYYHLGSLFGFGTHLAVASRLGLITTAAPPVSEDAPEYALTDLGREFVAQFGLSGFPPGRANAWPEAVTGPAADELERRWRGFA